MEAGVNGTCGGPRANEHAQVLDWNGNPINGLYVASNTMAAVTAGVYDALVGHRSRPSLRSSLDARAQHGSLLVNTETIPNDAQMLVNAWAT